MPKLHAMRSFVSLPLLCATIMHLCGPMRPKPVMIAASSPLVPIANRLPFAAELPAAKHVVRRSNQSAARRQRQQPAVEAIDEVAEDTVQHGTPAMVATPPGSRKTLAKKEGRRGSLPAALGHPRW